MCGVDVARQRTWRPCVSEDQSFWVAAFVAQPVVVVAVVIHLGSDGMTTSHAAVERISGSPTTVT